jgi:3-oxoacyl-[acyl-carrier-protein] synthase II
MGSRRRVAVTGLGVISPVGNTVEEFWKALLAGQSGVRTITQFDPEPYTCRIAGQVTDFDPEAFVDGKSARRMEQFTLFAIASARQAFAQSGLDGSGLDTAEIGCVMGVGIGGIGFTEESSVLHHERGPGRVSPFMITRIIPNMAPGQISIELGLRGPTLAVVTACAAGTHAIGEAAEMIRRGTATAMIAGGAESSISPLGIAGFCKMRALCADSNDNPAAASRPFDATRSGFVMGEGAGALMLEDWEFAVERGATILAEVAGYGLSSDAFHVTAPPEGAEGNQRAMRMALKDAGLAPEDIGYINAHGTSTELNDKMETQAIKAVFGEHAGRLAVSSTKSMTGHLLGAAGGVEAVASVMSLVDGKIHPTINYHNPDPECDLDYVPNEAREAPDLTAVMSNSLGFGGHNAVLILTRN